MTYRELLGMCDLVVIDAKRLAKCEPFESANKDLNDFFANDAVLYAKRLSEKISFLLERKSPNNSEATIHYYLKNGLKYLLEDERLEAKYMGIGVGRLPLNTRLMYYDLLSLPDEIDTI